MNENGKVLSMPHFAKRTMVLLAALLLGSWPEAFAQLGSTNLDGLQVKVMNIYRSGDSRDLDCSVGIQFAGDKADRAISMSKVTVLDAVDDTGKCLLRTNRMAWHDDFQIPSKQGAVFYSTVGHLKSPANDAKTIKRLAASVEFFAPAKNTPVLTNFMANPGRPLTHPTLAKCEVAITYECPVSNAPPGSLIMGDKADNTVTFKVEDPHNRIVRMAFQKPDGGILPASQQMNMANGKRTSFTYAFKEAPPRDLNLVVYVSEPEPSDTIAFMLENIRLPWIDPPVFEVSAASAKLLPGKGTNPCTGSLVLSFTGGPLTNALGIRNLWFTKIEDDSGRPVKARWMSQRFEAVPSVAMNNGRFVRKFVPLVFSSSSPRAIRILKGEAELVCPTSPNDYAANITNFMARVDQPFDLPLLTSNQVRLAYLGKVNYAAALQEFNKSNFVSQSGALLPAEFPSTNVNSLQFSLDDPNEAVIETWSNGKISFMDAEGQTLFPARTMVSGKFLVYFFKSLPPLETKLRICLAIPASLHRVPFKLENIPF